MKRKKIIWFTPFIMGLVLLVTDNCKKEDPLPVLTTALVTDITDSSETCGGDITSDGGSAIITRGICWSTDTTPTIADYRTFDGGGTGNFSSYITGLSPSTDYYIRAYAINDIDVWYGNVVSFSTNGGVPKLNTVTVSNITATTALSGGQITYTGELPITSKGVCWSTTETPTVADNTTNDGADTASFASVITDLTINTRYYVRAYANNNVGTGYGNVLSFETIVDIDGNVYQSVTIGTQVWMVKNLNVIHFRNDDPIPEITDNNEWDTLTSGAYCNYDNDTSLSILYGRLYNWFTVVDPRGLCPAGWHEPSDDEWTTLTTFLGGDDVAGCKLMEAGTVHWMYDMGTNESGFTALPGGQRSLDGRFDMINHGGNWWSTTEYSDENARYQQIIDWNCEVYRGSPVKNWGGSVRCIRD